MNNNALCYKTFGDPQQVLTLEAVVKPLPAEHHLRVKMLYAPVNASDLIPVTGAYRHRISPPLIAGYEGVGTVIEAPDSYEHLVGQRVLPLRGEGTWQQYVDSPARLAIAVPDDIADTLAARAYINPLAASLMLKHFPPAGKNVLVTAAGSDCGMLLGQWARQAGANRVTGIYRSAVHAARLAACGTEPVAESEAALFTRRASAADIAYDAVGGELAVRILAQMREGGAFISYGLLSGQAFRLSKPQPQVHWFHVRNYLQAMTAEAWQSEFARLWPLLRNSQISEAMPFVLSDWHRAIAAYQTAGRTAKPLLAMA